MISWWLILIAVIVAVMTVGLVIYLLVLFQAEEDKFQAWFPKVVVVMGMSLACFNVLLLPYDVANRQNATFQANQGGGINTQLAWQIVLYCIAGFTFLVVPFAMMYYEAHDPDQKSVLNQIKPAIIYTTVSLCVFLLLLIILWFTVGTARLDYQRYRCGPSAHLPSSDFDPATGARLLSYSDVSSKGSMNIKVSFFVYMVALLATIGWVFFFVFGGVGLVALPIDCIHAFIDRPKPISASDYALQKIEIAKESSHLIDAGKKLDDTATINPSRKRRRQVAAFKINVADLERKFEKIEICYREKGGQLLKAILQLVLGIVGFVLSLAWILHIILNNAAHVTPFLNSFFIALDNAFSLLGVLAYGIFAFYLLWCVVKGCTKIGVNLLLFTVYPMEVNKTLMNAFCFNTMLILITSVTVVQFCAESFQQYAANTSVNSLFTTYATKLKGIGYILIYFQYPLLGMAFLSLLWLLICPRRKVSDDDDE